VRGQAPARDYGEANDKCAAYDNVYTAATATTPSAYFHVENYQRRSSDVAARAAASNHGRDMRKRHHVRHRRRAVLLVLLLLRHRLVLLRRPMPAGVRRLRRGSGGVTPVCVDHHGGNSVRVATAWRSAGFHERHVREWHNMYRLRFRLLLLLLLLVWKRAGLLWRSLPRRLWTVWPSSRAPWQQLL
jgi:hypothetical protein